MLEVVLVLDVLDVLDPELDVLAPVPDVLDDAVPPEPPPPVAAPSVSKTSEQPASTATTNVNPALERAPIDPP